MYRLLDKNQENARKILLCGLAEFLGDMDGHSFYQVQGCVWSLTPRNVVYRCTSYRQSAFMTHRLKYHLDEESKRASVPNEDREDCQGEGRECCGHAEGRDHASQPPADDPRLRQGIHWEAGVLS